MINLCYRGLGAPHIGFMYRYEFYLVDKPQTVSLNQTVNLKVSQELNKGFSYRLLSAIDPSKKLCAGMPIRESYLSWQHSEALTIRMGCQKINQGGYDYLLRSINTRAPSGGSYTLPFSAYNPALTFDFNLWGNLQAQVVDDVKKGESLKGKPTRAAYYSNEKDNPTLLLSWQGENKIFQPLLQMGTYDQMKSSFFSVGFKSEVPGVYRLQGDYFHDRFYMVESLKDEIHTTMTLKGTWDASNFWKPYFYLRSYENKQPTDKKGNSSNDEIDDNILIYSVGAKGVCETKMMCPFINIDYEIEDFIKNNTTKENAQWKIFTGINGEI